MSKKWDTIYLDWDGVLWDFKQAWCDWFGHDVPETDKWEFFRELGLSPQEFQRLLAPMPRSFWQQPKYLMPHAHRLVDWARANAEELFVLTVAPGHDCSWGKQALADEHFGLVVLPVICAEHKVRDYAREGCLLIDDKPETVVKFAQECASTGGLIWPAEYNKGHDEGWYFDWERGASPEKATVKLPSIGVTAEEALKNISKAFEEPETEEKQEKLYNLGQTPEKWTDHVKLVTKASTQGQALEDLGMQPSTNNPESENMKPTNPKDIAGSSKVPMNSMLSGAVMGEVALALFEGALKYGRHNYRQDGVRASVYYDAVGRHLSAWWEGEDVDEESGLSHITKAIAGLHILRDCSIRGMCNDDRPPKTADFMKELNNKTKALIEKYPNPVPPVLEKEQGQCVPEDKPYSEGAESFTEYSDGSRSFTREFRVGKSDNTEFEWHRDHYDRRVRAVINGGGWFIQFAGEEPLSLGKDFITIKKGQEHRLLFDSEAHELPFDLIVEIFEYPDGLPEQSGCCGTGGCC